MSDGSQDHKLLLKRRKISETGYVQTAVKSTEHVGLFILDILKGMKSIWKLKKKTLKRLQFPPEITSLEFIFRNWHFNQASVNKINFKGEVSVRRSEKCYRHLQCKYTNVQIPQMLTNQIMLSNLGQPVC